MYKISFLAIAVFFITQLAKGQNFTNSDLNGSVAISAAPTGWQQVPNTDPASTASGSLQATSDICNTTGPSASAGILGTPYSGGTFVAGLHAEFSGSSSYHEGLMQTVSGLSVGTPYVIDFYQTVIKQSNALDPTGSWRVYVDNTLLATSTPSTSLLAYNATGQSWDNVSVAFTPTATSHTFKFLPYDDDANHLLGSSTSGGLRMGIDLITLGSTLPVELTTFTAKCEGGSAIVNWSTASERDCDYFVIEKSTNAENWSFVAKIQGNGTSSTAHNYAYQDNNLENEITYYRLKQIDLNGNKSTSDIVSIESCEINNQLMLYPNPASNQINLNVKANKDQQITIHILDLNGKTVAVQQGVSLFEGNNVVDMNIEDLDQAMYFLRIEVDGKVEVQKFTKVNP
ncbi:T9SS type A sorting domain-containing protein [Paracrocinitomix mangrovi]|uniref:T9SS type A sorting domain-containing protein n=1 Tax=Paracrocinitomix mangrovi TaxID=2862509 RepID=UPI001C8D882D|nr:T9SS type A sorting domain-containing protein [Paracrocinitomix mangrovi]UKN00123.1 T9SS type A sorting domain-containing protein [Paracrocinitomix mangrovi]